MSQTRFPVLGTVKGTEAQLLAREESAFPLGVRLTAAQ